MNIPSLPRADKAAAYLAFPEGAPNDEERRDEGNNSEDDADEWEYEYSATETETFYVTLDMTLPPIEIQQPISVAVGTRTNQDDLKNPLYHKQNKPPTMRNLAIDSDDDRDDDNFELPPPEVDENNQGLTAAEQAELVKHSRLALELRRRAEEQEAAEVRRRAEEEEAARAAGGQFSGPDTMHLPSMDQVFQQLRDGSDVGEPESFPSESNRLPHWEIPQTKDKGKAVVKNTGAIKTSRHDTNIEPVSLGDNDNPVHLEITNAKRNIPKLMSIRGFHTHTPLIRFQGRTFMGDWCENVGTELILAPNKEGEFFPVLRNLTPDVDLVAATTFRLQTTELNIITEKDKRERQEILTKLGKPKEKDRHKPGTRRRRKRKQPRPYNISDEESNTARDDARIERYKQRQFLKRLQQAKIARGETDTVPLVLDYDKSQLKDRDYRPPRSRPWNRRLEDDLSDDGEANTKADYLNLSSDNVDTSEGESGHHGSNGISSDREKEGDGDSNATYETYDDDSDDHMSISDSGDDTGPSGLAAAVVDECTDDSEGGYGDKRY